jgi:uncharacterized protein (TIGR03437 family)
MDAAGSIYISDAGNARIRKISPGGIISTIAGSGQSRFSGDGGLATAASLNSPEHLAIDLAGNLYIADYGNQRVRKVGPDGVITTVAGNGTKGFSGDDGPATAASLNQPRGLVLDAAGNLYISDSNNFRVRKVTARGIVVTVAGTGVSGSSGDGGPATRASLGSLGGVALDSSGSLYVAVPSHDRVRRIGPDGIITTVAGSGTRGFSGDGGPATAASLYRPGGLAFDQAGNLYVSEEGNGRVRKISSSGVITTVTGNGLFKFSGDGGPAVTAALNQPSGAALDASGNLFIADSYNYRVRKVSPSGVISTLAGIGIIAYSGDGGPATSASFNRPESVAVDGSGNLYIADSNNQRVRKVSPSGVVSTIAGNGTVGFSGDGGPATAASFRWPLAVAVDRAGSLYIADDLNHRVRKVGPTGIITTLAGNGVQGSSGDGGPATGASLYYPAALAVDAAGNVFIADWGNNRIRKVDPGGIITTVAGSGARGFSGDGGPATSAALIGPEAVATDTFGNVYIGDTGNRRVRKVSPAGIIVTVAGNGVQGFAGDGGPATSASLYTPFGLAVDAAGNLYIADYDNDRIRKVLATPPAFSVAPSKVSLTAISGMPGGGGQQIIVSSAIAGLEWNAQASTASSGNWLLVTPATGVIPGTVSVSVDASKLAAGSYRGTVTLQAPLAVPALQTIAVELTVAPAPALELALERGSLTFEAIAGEDNPPAQAVRVTNAGGGTLNWAAVASTGSGGNWLRLSPASGTASAAAPASVQISANITGLLPGVYSGSIRVESATTQQAKTIPVSLLVLRPTQTILASQSGLLFTGVEGGEMVPPQSFGIVNTGQGVMSWAVGATTLSGGIWLRVSPGNGSSDARSLQIPEVEVSVGLAGLRAGQYSGLVRIDAPGASNSPQYVTVELNILPRGSNPGVLVRPTGLIFAARAGTSSPGSQTVRLATAAPGTLDFVSGLLTFDGGNWLEVLPRNGSLAAAEVRKVVVQPALGAIAPGIYRGTLTLLFADGSCHTVNILFVVVGRGVAPAGVRAFDSAACVASRLFAVQRTLGNNFVLQAGWPGEIEVQVTDDCGGVVANAAAVAYFTNGDAPLPLASLRNGIYTGTWRPMRAAAGVSVEVRVMLPPLDAAQVRTEGQVQSNPAAAMLFPGGVVNAASFAAGEPLAPGSIISVFGANLAATSAGAPSLPLPKTLAGASLQVGGYDVPLFYSSGGQINAQLPFELPVNTRPQLIVKGADFVTVPETITVAAARPGIFTITQDGKGQGVIMDVANRLVDASNPAKAGDVVVVYCTGLGATNPAARSGEAAPTSPLAKVVTPVTVTIGGQPAAVQFAGLTPGLVGLYQVNVQILSGVTPGASVPLVISQDGVPSNTVTLGIR